MPQTMPDNQIINLYEQVLTLQGEGDIIAPPEKFVYDVKMETKYLVKIQEKETMVYHVNQLVKQGKYLELSQMEGTDATWKSLIFNLPRGTMKFILNSTLDTLPTRVNLKMWCKVSNDKCRCGVKQTLNHILNCCLNEGRFT